METARNWFPPKAESLRLTQALILVVQILIPPTLRRFCGGVEQVLVQPGTVAQAIDQLHDRFNGIRDRLLDANGRIRAASCCS